MIMSVETIASIVEFFSMISGGFVISLLFDVFRSMRKAVRSNNGKTPDFVVLIQDMIFLLAAFVISVLLIYKVSSGRLPWYVSAGCLCGASLYFFIVEKISGKVFFAVFYCLIKSFKFALNLSCKVYRKVNCSIRATNN